MFIANGRVGADATQRKVTCKDVSLLDYVICSPTLLQHITEFNVNDYDPMLSDIHCAVIVSLTCQSNNNELYVDHNAAQPEQSKCRKEPKRPKWKTEMASEFTECLNDISNMMAELDRLDSTGSTEQSDINTCVDEITRIFCTTARELNISATTAADLLGP